ncbi:TPA: glycosyltransferase family 4 protein, partial [Neisseria gonorrhoeae]
MKIVFITTVASSIYGFRAPVIKKLIGKNHQVYAFVSEFSDNELDIIREMGVTPVTYRSNRSGVNPFSDIKSTFLIFKALKKISPDLVVPYFAKPVIFGTFAAKLAGVPRIVGMLEGLGFAFTPQPEGIPLKTKIIKGILIALYRITLPMLESLIVLNPDDKDELLHQYGIKIKNIHILGGIGLDLRQYPYSEADIPDEKEPVKFLFIGRFLKEKGIDDFIRAAEQVKGKYPDTVFTALGAIDKPRGSGDLEQPAARDIIRFPGFVNNVSEVIKEH